MSGFQTFLRHQSRISPPHLRDLTARTQMMHSYCGPPGILEKKQDSCFTGIGHFPQDSDILACSLVLVLTMQKPAALIPKKSWDAV